MRLVPERLRLYLVTDSDLCRGYGLVQTVSAAVNAGVTIVQLRDKDATTEMLIAQGRALQAVLAGTTVPLIINDDIDAAIALDADGVHVGQGDMRAEDVRAKVGAKMIIGLSCETVDDARRVNPAIVDYIGVSPIFSTPTKTDHKGPVGLAGLDEICRATTVPKVAIGGLKYEHCDAILSRGADGMAVVSAICGQNDPAAKTHELATEIDRVIRQTHDRDIGAQ
jgi:thiamine-phosphate pyrophosphorylase